MKYLGNLFLSLREIVLIMLGEYFLLFLCFVILGEEESIIWGSVLLLIFMLSYIIWRLKGITIKVKAEHFFYILLGVGISSLYNMIALKITGPSFSSQDIPLILNILCSGIVGPIFEETVFRYGLISKLEKFNSKPWVVILLSGFIFGIFHTGIITIIYAFFIGIINSYIYVKKRDIMGPIIIHMAGNSIAIFLSMYNSFILVLATLLIIIGIIGIRRS